MDFKRLAILAVMDFLLLAELTLAIWWAHFDPASISWRFAQAFLPPVIMTIAATRWAFRRWAPKAKVSREAMRAHGVRPFSLFGALGEVRLPDRPGRE